MPVERDKKVATRESLNAEHSNKRADGTINCVSITKRYACRARVKEAVREDAP